MNQARIHIGLDGERLDGDVLSRLSRLELRETDADPTVAVLRFRLAQEPGGEFFPLDHDVFSPGARLTVDLGAPGGLPTRLLDGHVTHQRPHFEGIEANCYLEVVAMDAGALLGLGDRVAAYPDSSDADAARQIFGRHRLASEVTDTQAQHEADGQLLVQRESDWRFLQRLARRNGFRCYLEPHPDTGEVTAHFGPPALAATPQADLTILRAGANLAWLDIQETTAAPTSVSAAAIDPIRKRLVRADAASSQEAMGGELALPAVDSALDTLGIDARTRLLRDAPPLGAALVSEAAARSDDAQLLLEARGELDPALYRGLLRARRPVLLKGVGRRHAGTWYVTAVRSVLDEGALTQTFAAVRNAVAPSGREEFGRDAEEVGPE
jgi:phage protein D